MNQQVKSSDFRVKMQTISNKIQKNKYIAAISGGLASLNPVLIIGALFSLFAGIQFTPYQDFITSTGLKEMFNIGSTVTINLLALYASFSIAYNLAKELDKDAFSIGLISTICFLILIPTTLSEDGYTTFLSFDWLGAKGLFVSFIAAIVVGNVYSFMIDKGVYFKMPKNVPSMIEKSFAALTPGLASIIIFLIIRIGFSMTSFETLPNFIYSMIQQPLTSLGGTWYAMIICVFITNLLWWFGIHGSIVVLSVMSPIWLPLDLANLAAYEAGATVLPNMFGTTFYIVYTAIGGNGCTFGLAINMLRSKSVRFKTMSKMTILPSFFSIDEPLKFGIPLVLNPKFFVPLVFTPIVCVIIAIIATMTGIVPYLNGTQIPVGIPILGTALIAGGWKVVILQAILIIISYFCWRPFFKRVDEEEYELETKEQ